jgi:hypothetical protein
MSTGSKQPTALAGEDAASQTCVVHTRNMRKQETQIRRKKMKLGIFTNHESRSLVFSAALLAMLLVAAGSPCAQGQSQTGVHRPPANGSGIPIAFASVASVGTKQSGTSNITTDYNTSTGLYELKIAGVCFLRTSYTTVATVSGYNGFPNGALFVNTDDDGHFCRQTGKLIVGLRDVGGDLKQADFQVVVFKAH